MSVVNCKVKYIRPQYNDLEEWAKDDNNVGRGGVLKVKDSLLNHLRSVTLLL